MDGILSPDDRIRRQVNRVIFDLKPPMFGYSGRVT
jgi:hypothetical protein